MCCVLTVHNILYKFYIHNGMASLKKEKSVMVYSSTYGRFHTVYHDGTIPRKKYSVSYGAHEAELERCLTIFCQGRTLITDINLLWMDDKKLGSINEEKYFISLTLGFNPSCLLKCGSRCMSTSWPPLLQTFLYKHQLYQVHPHVCAYVCSNTCV